jgi:DNA-binding GntR family transcriptional regulator
MPVPAQEPAPRVLLRETAYEAIRRAIVDGTLAPGERLRDAELCTWLGLSRTPVREALGRLEEEGLVETRPQSFTRVTPLSRRDAREAFPVVAALHALATELAVPGILPSELAKLREANQRFATAMEQQDTDAALAADDEFHAVFVRVSGNSEIARTLERLVPRLRRLERVQFASLSGRRSVKQHDRIITLAAKGEAADAGASVRENWLTLGALIDRSFPKEDAP